MLEDSGLGEELWAEAMVTTNYIRNRVPSRVHRKTPWEKFFGEKPDVSHMHVFGARAYMRIPKENRKKMQSVSERGVFMGYEPDCKAYRVLRERDGRILVSRDVIVNEKPAFGTSGSKKEEQGARDLSHVSPPTQMDAGNIPTGKSGTGREESNGPSGVLTWGATTSQKLPLQIDLKDEEDGKEQELRRNPARERRTPARYRANLAIEGSNPRGSMEHHEPQTYQEAVSGEESELWQKSMDEEMHSLLENGTWELVERPEGVKPIPMKWVYKVKRDAQGNIEWYKSRLVAKGFLQKQGVDFEEVYALVSKHTTLRVLLAIVAQQDLELHQLDVKTAFLNGELEEEIYMQQPQGYEQGGPNIVCRLLRTLYGLRQAPRAWHQCLKKVLENLEFVASSTDAALFQSTMDGETVWLLVWVDDILVAAQGEERVAKVKVHLTAKFDVRDLGPATYFLGMELSHDREAPSLKLTQKKLMGELNNRYGLAYACARSVPQAAGEKLRKEGEPLDTVRFPYSECVGSQLYLSVCTRPDIAQAVGVLARYMAAPTIVHWEAALGVVCYLVGIVDYGLTFGGSSEIFVGYYDANYTGDLDSRRSTTGYVFLMFGER
jgi:hypothetical protein